MGSNLFFLGLISSHLIGDYYLQTSHMAESKKDSFVMTLKHGIYYGMAFLVLPIIFKGAIGLVLLAIGTHFLIDLFKFQVEKKENKGRFHHRLNPQTVYILDQGVHLFTLFLISELMYLPLLSYLTPWGWQASLFLTLLPALLFLFKPANITFKILFGRFSPKEKDLVSLRGAGAVIGSLERLLMLIFLGLSQFAAVGLIMTAKSIARYDKISKDPIFAEYYLIGTLYSILVTVILYLLFLL